MNIRKATTNDVKQITELINLYAAEDIMLTKKPFQVYETIRSFYVAEDKGEIVACCALGLYYEGLGEVKSLAVKQTHHKKGLGRELVKACIGEGKELNIKKVFALTYQDKFFERLGFREGDKETLPQKIWAECINCHKFPNCNEICMILDL